MYRACEGEQGARCLRRLARRTERYSDVRRHGMGAVGGGQSANMNARTHTLPGGAAGFSCRLAESAGHARIRLRAWRRPMSQGLWTTRTFCVHVYIMCHHAVCSPRGGVRTAAPCWAVAIVADIMLGGVTCADMQPRQARAAERAVVAECLSTSRLAFSITISLFFIIFSFFPRLHSATQRGATAQKQKQSWRGEAGRGESASGAPGRACRGCVGRYVGAGCGRTKEQRRKQARVVGGRGRPARLASVVFVFIFLYIYSFVLPRDRRGW
jgi:hypothetical protein